MNYFKKFPTTFYGSHAAVNILSQSALSKVTKNNKFVFYPYSMPEAMRPDMLAQRYYDSPEYEWLVHFSNSTIDPYYGYMLNEKDFYNYIVKKYGSWQIASRKIYFYRLNWLSESENITITEYENLDGDNKKYYTPVTDNNFNTVAYRRLRTDTTINTNKIVQLNIEYLASEGGSAFVKGEEVQVDGTNYAFCTTSDSSTVIVQHVTGEFNVDDIIVGYESASAAKVTGVTVLATPLADGTGTTVDERRYWEPVTYLQYEEELNMRKKEIRLVDKVYATVANEQLAAIMRNK